VGKINFLTDSLSCLCQVLLPFPIFLVVFRLFFWLSSLFRWPLSFSYGKSGEGTADLLSSGPVIQSPVEKKLKLRNESISNYRFVDLKTLISQGLLFITIIQSYVIIISRKYDEDIEQSIL